MGQAAFAGASPAFLARFAAAFGGGGGMLASMKATNPLSSPIANAGLNRRSKPIVEDGLPESPLAEIERLAVPHGLEIEVGLGALV